MIQTSLVEDDAGVRRAEVSLRSFDEPAFDRITGTRGNFARAMQGLGNAIERFDVLANESKCVGVTHADDLALVDAQRDVVDRHDGTVRHAQVLDIEQPGHRASIGRVGVIDRIPNFHSVKVGFTVR